MRVKQTGSGSSHMSQILTRWLYFLLSSFLSFSLHHNSLPSTFRHPPLSSPKTQTPHHQQTTTYPQFPPEHPIANMVKWNDENENRLLMAIIHVMGASAPAVNWDTVAGLMGPGYTAGGIRSVPLPLPLLPPANTPPVRSSPKISRRGPQLSLVRAMAMLGAARLPSSVALARRLLVRELRSLREASAR